MRWIRAAVISGLCAGSLLAQSTIFIVRHADRYGTEPDPSITEEGQRQAAALARLLADAHITRIFTSEALRTQQTAAPTARQARIQPTIVDAGNLDELIRLVRTSLRPGEATLIVGHRGTVPRIVKALTGESVSPLAVDEYDRLQVVTLFPGGQSSVLTLRFGHDHESGTP